MEHGFSVLMLIFSGAILLYALLMMATGSVHLLPYHVYKTMKKTKDDRVYVRHLGRAVALTAAAPLLGGVAGFFAPPLITAIITVGSFILLIWLSTRLMKGVQE